MGASVSVIGGMASICVVFFYPNAAIGCNVAFYDDRNGSMILKSFGFVLNILITKKSHILYAEIKFIQPI